MAAAEIRSSAPIWRTAADGQTHAWVESSVGRFACGMFATRSEQPIWGCPRCLDCVALVGIEISINVGGDRRLNDDARALSDASERTAAAATVVDLVIADLRILQGGHVLRLEEAAPAVGPAIVDLYEVRASLHDIAGRMRQAAARADHR